MVFVLLDLAVMCSVACYARVDVYKVDCMGQVAVLVHQTGT